MNKQQPQQEKRDFNEHGRNHTVGQFLNAHPEAKRVFNAGLLKRQQQGMFSIQARARLV
jgi:hypothetical protein